MSRRALEIPAQTTPSANAHTPSGAPSGSVLGRKPGRPAGKKTSPKVVYENKQNAKPRIRYYIPSVAKHVARVIVKHAMDYHSAITQILGERASEINVDELAQNLEKDEQVQLFIQEELTVHGLDEKSKEVYVRELWDWFRGQNEHKAMKAAGILGKGFIAEKVESDKPEELPIPGLSSAVKSMLGERDTDDTTITEPPSPALERGPLPDPEGPNTPQH